MPLRHLHHDLLKVQVQTPSSSLKSTIDSRFVQEPDYFDKIDNLQSWAIVDRGSQANSEDVVKFAGSPQVQMMEADAPTRSEKPKLLVCHDFKGGYTEDPFEQGYSFEFWHLVDTFIYFSHNRVTIPPRGWLDAGRRHGVKVFGTVIFEWAESKPDLQKCLYGEMLDKAENTTPPTTDTSVQAFSTKYASYLITLAQVRKIDGYLLNIETDLNFIPPISSYPAKTQVEQDEDTAFLEWEKKFAGLGAHVSPDVQLRRARRMRKNVNALLGWVQWLREEGKRQIGSHWEVIWYDSVTTTGQLEWQDALTPANAPFFVNSDAIFTNYTWARPPDPAPPGTFPEKARPHFEHHPALLQSSNMAESLDRSKSDIYVGIDVFGRNCYGGFAVGLSLDMIFPSRNSKVTGSAPGEDRPPHDLGLSVALFAPGWTWEREKEGGGERTWGEWWEDELRFWFGSTIDGVPVWSRESGHVGVGTFFGPREHSLLRTVSTLAASRSVVQLHDPNLSLGNRSVSSVSRQYLSSHFYTNFNRGSGLSWWVRGRRVYDAFLDSQEPAGRRGWTDIGSCFPKPDRIWPRPMLLYLEDGDRGATATFKQVGCDQVVLRTALIGHEAWEGGTSLMIEMYSLEDPDRTAVANSSERTFLPLCTLRGSHIALSGSYTIKIVFKHLSVFTDLRPCILWSDCEPAGRGLYRTAQKSSHRQEVHELSNGWCSTSLTAQWDSSPPNLPAEVAPVIALEISCTPFGSKNMVKRSTNLKIIVGEISLFSITPPSPVTPSRPENAVLSQDPHHLSLQTSYKDMVWQPVPLPRGAPVGTLWGILTWQPCEMDTTCATGYYNVFASRKLPEELETGTSAPAYVWLGTSTYESNANTFVVAGLYPSDVTASGDPTVIGEGFNTQATASAQSSPLAGSLADGGSPLYPIYFVVEGVGSVGGLPRYVCEVEN